MDIFKKYRDLKIGTRLIGAFLGVGILAITAIGYVGYSTAKTSLEEEQFNKLTAIRDMKSFQIEDYFQQIRDQVKTFSEDRMIIEAMMAFKESFHKIDSELGITDADMSGIDSSVKSYYKNEFLPRLNPNIERAASVTDYWPKDRNTRILQNLYLASNPNATGSKHNMDNAKDGSTYSDTHRVYHPIIKSYLEKFGYYDIFLVDPDTGHIVYTVFKEVDYGTSLLSGPYSRTNFAEAFKTANNSSNKDFVTLEDFKPYHPSYNAAASFIASPIYEGSEKVGVLLFQMPVDKINNIMTNNNKWAAVGLGESGETYIVGDDYTLKNQSRFLIEDSENYFKMIETVGLAKATVEKIKNLESAIGLQTVKTKGTEAALKRGTNNEIFPDYRGVSVLSAYKPLNIKDVNWVIMSEIDEAEAFRPVYSFRNATLLWSTVLIAVIFGIAFVFSKSITRPLNKTVNMLRDIAQGEGDLTKRLDVETEDEIGEMAGWFNQFLDKIHEIVSKVVSSTHNIAKTSEQLNESSAGIAQGAEDQAQQTERVATAMGEMNATVTEVARNSQSASEVATEAQSTAAKGGEIVSTAVNAIEELTSLVERTSGEVKLLGDNSEQIGGIIETIDDIADQTNLLALNAAIEAARAGEQGRGFAVVADEVRLLAERTTKATSEVRERISTVQDETSKVVQSMEAGTTKSEEGVELARSAGSALQDIVQSVDKVTGMIQQIATAAEEQSATTDEISTNVDGMASITNETANQVKGNADAIQSLNSTAEELKTLVEGFKV